MTVPEVPRQPVPVPGGPAAAVGGPAGWVAVWWSVAGAVTWRSADRRRYVKWIPTSAATTGAVAPAPGEAERMVWAGAFTVVPTVLDVGGDDEGTWLVTAAIDNDSAVAPRCRAEPAVAVRAIGAGLTAWHAALPVAGCPWAWSAADRVASARRRHQDPADWHEEHRSLGVDAALALLADAPPVDRLVVAHGDACAPNTLVDGAGRCAGHVDVGRLGVADRWADLAVACWSTTWNYGPGWDAALLDAYGIDDDPERREWYRLVWDLE